ncbi:MAG: M28 family peptidase [Rhodothermales bacterium]
MPKYQILRKSTKRLYILFLPLLPTLFLSPSPLTAQPQSPLPYAQSIVDTLSSQHFAGRGYQHDADGRAADFIAHAFSTIGLQPVFAAYQQSFPISVDIHTQTPDLKINDEQLTLGTEFLPYPGSISGTAEATKRIVYAGAGLYIPELQLNDYDGKNPTNAVVILEEQIPEAIRMNEKVNPQFLVTSTRIEIARLLGAKAVILLTNNNLAHGFTPVNTAIPAFMVSKQHWPETADYLSYSIQSTLDWETTTTNVAGKIPGTEKPEEYLLVTAHYDHLGSMGPDFYFPGANDNASGVALTLALADYFEQHPLKRSLVFVGFSAEEEGLQGSQHFVAHPPMPLDSIRFLINLDMVASGNQGIMTVAGSDFEPEYNLLTQINDSLQTGPLSKRPNAPNSDHYFFLEQGVRGFFLYTNKGDQPYHHPQDLYDSLDWDDFMHMYELVKQFLIALDAEE